MMFICVLLLSPRPPDATLFPYTTLFRSTLAEELPDAVELTEVFRQRSEKEREASTWLRSGDEGRSEEHTSELQSRGHLVCRLLLEKKKKKESGLHPTRLGRNGDERHTSR